MAIKNMHTDTNQKEKVIGVKKQKRNNAGGISFKLNKWDLLMRFLVMGTEGGTFYVKERKLTKDATKNVRKCIKDDGKRVVNTIVSVSEAGRAANNDYAIFALALCMTSDELEVRKYAITQLSRVCRISTHLFHFVDYLKQLRGFNRTIRDGIAKWYTSKHVGDLAYQMLKYQGRDGWTHRDVLRLCHAHPNSKAMDKLFGFAVGKREKIPKVSIYAKGARKIKDAAKVKDAVKIIKDHKLTREVIPTHLMKEITVWEELLQNMPLGAMIRNLGKMSSLGMHKPLSDTVKLTAERLTNEDWLKKARIHPIQMLNALMVYGNGCGVKGSLTWETNSMIADALQDGFYKTFKFVEPCNKNIMLSIDVSGSMSRSMGGAINGMALDCREASAVMAMVTARTEPNCFTTVFSASGENAMSYKSNGWHGHDGISTIGLSKNDDIGRAIDRVSGLEFGATDCSLPMLYCTQREIDVDAIVIYTDSETYVGQMHPWQALDVLEQKLGHEVKLIVVGMQSNQFTIAKPDASNMLDVVGFSTDTPSVISNFIRS